jgi:hypothetical protein
MTLAIIGMISGDSLCANWSHPGVRSADDPSGGIRAAVPDWVWFAVTGSTSVKLTDGRTFSLDHDPADTELYAGPAHGSYLVELSLTDVSIGIPNWDLKFSSIPYDTRMPVAPYSP